MVKAIEHAFRNSALVFCTIHLKKNIVRHLRKNKKGVSDKMIRKIKHKLFGRNGVLHANNETEFVIKRLEFEAKYGDKFSVRYLDNLMNRLLSNVLKPHLTSDAIGIDWTNNNCESMNANLKGKARRETTKALSVPQLIAMFSRSYKLQEAYIQSAFQNFGKFQLIKGMRKHPYFMSPKAWQGRTKTARAKLTTKFRTGTVKKPAFVKSKCESIVVPNKPHWSGKPGAKARPTSDRTTNWNRSEPVVKKTRKSASKAAVATLEPDKQLNSIQILENILPKKGAKKLAQKPVVKKTLKSSSKAAVATLESDEHLNSVVILENILPKKGAQKPAEEPAEEPGQKLAQKTPKDNVAKKKTSFSDKQVDKVKPPKKSSSSDSSPSSSGNKEPTTMKKSKRSLKSSKESAPKAVKLMSDKNVKPVKEVKPPKKKEISSSSESSSNEPSTSEPSSSELPSGRSSADSVLDERTKEGKRITKAYFSKLKNRRKKSKERFKKWVDSNYKEPLHCSDDDYVHVDKEMTAEMDLSVWTSSREDLYRRGGDRAERKHLKFWDNEKKESAVRRAANDKEVAKEKAEGVIYAPVSIYTGSHVSDEIELNLSEGV
jgi:hypothetical protein